MGYMGDLIVIYPKPYSIYLRGPLSRNRVWGFLIRGNAYLAVPTIRCRAFLVYVAGTPCWETSPMVRKMSYSGLYWGPLSSGTPKPGTRNPNRVDLHVLIIPGPSSCQDALKTSVITNSSYSTTNSDNNSHSNNNA